MLAIFKREFKAYFLSPIGYVFLTVFYFASNFFFYGNCITGNNANLNHVFSNLIIILIFIIPALTMKLISEDKKLGTDQLLLTSPVKLSSIILGKFFAALTTFFIGIAITFGYAILLSFFSHYDWISFLCNIIGLLLLGSALISIGIFISSLTENQIISIISSFAIMLLLLLIETISMFIKTPLISKIISYISIVNIYHQFTYGSFSLPNVILFLGLITIFLFLTTRVLEKKRWSN